MAQPATVQIDSLLGEVRGLSSSLNAADRAKVQQSLLSTLQNVESPYENMLRLSGSHLQLALIRLGVDLGIFRTLVDSGKPVSSEELGKKHGIEPELLRRVLRFLASVDVVNQTDKDAFTASKITTGLTTPGMESGSHLFFDLHDRTYQALPDCFKDLGYKDLNDISNGIFQKAFETDLSCYDYLVHDPTLQGHMQDAMKSHLPEGSWLSVFPLDELQRWSDSNPDRVLFVDIGGGMGHQCIRLREQYPDIPGRVILQDMPITIGRLPKTMPHGIEAMAHDFDKPQPIKNAKFYYLRNVLHGLPDSGCVAALKKIHAAMNSESMLIIDDLVVPDQGACREACQLDFVMMASIAGKKRTRDEWYKLVEASGFKIVDIRTYTRPLEDSLILASPVLLN